MRTTMLLVSLALVGCSVDAVVATDGDAAADAALGDAGRADAGGSDAGDDDAGGSDAGPSDAGPSDGGPLDGGTSDGGADAGPGCSDDDGDGVTVCDGDCDDSAPLVFPGAPEVCGDGVDNACGSDPDPASLCGGMGAHVSPAGDDSTGDGTRNNPVQTLARGIALATSIGAPMTVVVAGGTYTETVTLVEGISIQGGYDCSALPCSWDFDPSTHTSVVDGGTAAALEADRSGVTRATRVEHLTLRSTRTAVRLRETAPVLRRCEVEGSVTFSGSATGPRIEECTVEAGTGVGVSGVTGGEVLRCDIVGAPAVDLREGVTVRSSVLHGSGGVTAAALWGTALLDGNLINPDASRQGPGSCDFGPCSGVSVYAGSPRVQNNVIYPMEAAPGSTPSLSTGVAVVSAELEVDRAIVNSNTIDLTRLASTAGTEAAGLSCLSTFGIATIGEFRNNIVLAGAETSFGIYEEDHTSGNTCRPVAVENNDFFGFDHVARLWSGGTPSTLTTLVAAEAESWASNNLTDDPRLDGDHRLMAGSPCIDRGTATDAPATDRDGDARPAGANDIGADER